VQLISLTCSYISLELGEERERERERERELQVVGILKHYNTQIDIYRFIADGTEYSSNVSDSFIQLLVQNIWDQTHFHLLCSAVEITMA
jgi:hypothetical protein